MTIENNTPHKKANRRILSYINDLPNVCSLIGLGCTLLAIYFLLIGIYPAAMIGMIWAVGFDWADGLIARRMKGRILTDQKFGGQLDLLIDVVSYGVTPAILIMSFSNFNIAFLPVIFAMLVFGVMRLSYFSTFGLTDDAKYTGLAIDNNSIILVFIFMFSEYFESSTFAIILAVSGLCLAVLNVSQIETPKLSGSPLNVIILSVYIIFVTVFYGSTLL